jgi:hypothetical protein
MAYVAGRKETGLHMSYRSPSNNALKQIKCKEDFTERVGDTWEEAEEGMKSQIIATMDSLGYSYDSIERYVRLAGTTEGEQRIHLHVEGRKAIRRPSFNRLEHLRLVPRY